MANYGNLGPVNDWRREGEPRQGERMSEQHTINQANKVEFSYTKRREIILDSLTTAFLRQIFG